VLSKGRKSIVNGEGPLHAGMAFIGEAPGEREDVEGRPFVGRSGKFLSKVLSEHGIDRSAVFITNVVRCRPPGNRRPSEGEIANCRDYLIDELKKVKPKVVVALGASALRSLNGFTGRLGDVVGSEQNVVLGGLVLSVVPCYHPSVAMRNKRLRAAFSEAISAASTISNRP